MLEQAGSKIRLHVRCRSLEDESSRVRLRGGRCRSAVRGADSERRDSGVRLSAARMTLTATMNMTVLDGAMTC